jgi:hypothetical protein
MNEIDKILRSLSVKEEEAMIYSCSKPNAMIEKYQEYSRLEE